MTTIAFNSFSKSGLRSPLFPAWPQNITSQSSNRKRWIHQSTTRQAIMMPAMSPFMTEGTITRWKKKEGEAFSVGDVLLQIESDIAMIDIQAENAGILSKILLPDGSTNVPVEQVIALVVKDAHELTNTSTPAPAPPPYNPTPSLPGRSLSSPVHVEQFNQPFTSPAHRSPSLFEMHTMGHNARHVNVRGIMMKHTRAPGLTIVPPAPQVDIQRSPASVSLRTGKLRMPTPRSALGIESTNIDEKQLDGAAIRRMIVSNLSRAPASATLSKSGDVGCFDGLL